MHNPMMLIISICFNQNAYYSLLQNTKGYNAYKKVDVLNPVSSADDPIIIRLNFHFII